MLLDAITKYYGVDLLAMVLSFIGIYHIGSKKRYGFILTSLGNVIWIIFGILTMTVGLIVANLVLIILNIRAYNNWKKL